MMVWPHVQLPQHALGVHREIPSQMHIWCERIGSKLDRHINWSVSLPNDTARSSPDDRAVDRTVCLPCVYLNGASGCGSQVT